MGTVAGNLRLEEVVIHRDHTVLAKGKFWCQASIDGWPIDDSEKFKAGRGDSIVLDSAAWQRAIWVDEGAEATLRFEVFEANDNDHASIGVVQTGISPPWPEGVRSVDADSGDFTLRYRAWTPAAAAPNQLRVVFLEVQVLDDGDVSSEGELFFLGAANAERTGLSTLHKAKGGETVRLQASQWTLDVGLQRDDALTLEFTSYDDDREALEALGTLRVTFGRNDKWGLGEHLLTAPGGAFRLRVRVEPADADSLPDLPGLRQLEVAFTSVLVHDDGDDHSNGEITFEASLMGQPVMVTPEYKVSPGDRVYLAEGGTPRSVWVDDGDTLEIGLAATERDNARVDALGTAIARHTATDGFGVGQHTVPAGNGAFDLTYEVRDASVPRLLVKFLQVHVLKDHEWLGRGEIVCEAVANGIGTGPSERMKAGSDNPNRPQDDRKSDVFLGGPRWRKRVPVDPDAPSLDLRFTVVELDTLSRDDLLGTVDLTLAGEDLLSAAQAGRRIHELRADTGRFDLVFLVQLV